ncbi:unnamed protein product [Sympodiomycopsis kandeliae]
MLTSLVYSLCIALLLLAISPVSEAVPHTHRSTAEAFAARAPGNLAGSRLGLRASKVNIKADTSAGFSSRLKTQLKNTSPGYDADNVLSKGEDLAQHSWEYGIITQALIDYYSPSLSVFTKSVFSKGKMAKPVVSKTAALSYAQPKIDLSRNDTLIDGAGSNGDPASLVPPALLIGQSDSRYLSAVDRQMQHVLNAPRFYNGAISQRDAVAELWADGMYMHIPALAYYGVQKQDAWYVTEAARQSGLYRQVLIANTTAQWKGLWTHIVGPQSQTLGIWLTGNGWAAMGMSRILAIMMHWPQTSSSTSSQQANLKTWIYEILNGAKSTQLASNGLLKNYLVGGPSGQKASPSADFGDATGTAMIASTVYRMAVLDTSGQAKAYISWADGLRKAVAKNVQGDGLLVNTVDPLNWFSTQPYMKGSPEGQGAAGLLAAAYRDCVQASAC